MDKLTDFQWRGVEVFLIIELLAVLFVVVMLALSGGCITKTKGIITDALEEDTPIPTTEPVVTTQTPVMETPEPTPTIDEVLARIKWMKENHGYFLNEWHQWYREDVSGKQDMIIRATVYNYKFLKSFHWRDFSWGSRAKRLETPPAGTKFLFVFIRMENIGTVGSTYGWGRDDWNLQINQTIYGTWDEFNPEWIITELENDWTRDHVEMPSPYPYKRIQEAGSGIIRVEEREWLHIGEPWDGYIIYVVPDDTKLENMKMLGNFDNVGGTAWWAFDWGNG